ncbi:MAG TPA: SGNH/GDSL hydrolase family protein [Thermomicrobiaceae bacterium]|nr:SGNH/GDSL hydrolase family protein [Thermomicrobiaceae bacterium]
MIQPIRRLIIILLAASLVAGSVFWWRERQPAAAARPVYVALGASDTVGVGADQPALNAWVPLVAAGLPGNPALVNLGINGATVDDVLRQELPVALDAKPEWVTLWPGVNDIRHGVELSDFSRELNTVLDQLRPTHAHVVLLTIPDLRLLPAFAGFDAIELDQVVHQWNAVIADAARRYGVILVDLYADAPELARHPEYLSGDGFHPSSAGYRRIADLVLKEIHAHAVSPAA